MTRRRFAFWLGFGLFSLSEKLRMGGLDAMAAAAMRRTETKSASKPVAKESAIPEHWTVAADKDWQWFERENFVDGQWQLTGTTAPINRSTGQRKADPGDYLDDSLVPAAMRRSDKAVPLGDQSSDADVATERGVEFRGHHPSAVCRARHGRPPSKWLRSLHADELRIWLRSIDVPEAGVSGMTYWTHLTRDHSFDPLKIEGLTIPEQAKLHAAAHYGY